MVTLFAEIGSISFRPKTMDYNCRFDQISLRANNSSLEGNIHTDVHVHTHRTFYTTTHMHTMLPSYSQAGSPWLKSV